MCDEATVNVDDDAMNGVVVCRFLLRRLIWGVGTISISSVYKSRLLFAMLRLALNHQHPDVAQLYGQGAIQLAVNDRLESKLDRLVEDCAPPSSTSASLVNAKASRSTIFAKRFASFGAVPNTAYLTGYCIHDW